MTQEEENTKKIIHLVKNNITKTPKLPIIFWKMCNVGVKGLPKHVSSCSSYFSLANILVNLNSSVCLYLLF